MLGRVLLIPGALLLTSALVPLPLNLTYPCELAPTSNEWVRAPFRGVIADVLVEEGGRVAAGQPLLRLLDSELNLELTRAQSRLARAAAELAQLERGPTPEQLARLETRLTGLREELRLAQKTRERIAGLVASGMGAPDELDRATQQQESLRGELNEASAELKLLKAGALHEELEAKRAEVMGVKAEVAFAERRLAQSTLRAKATGSVITRRPHLLAGTAVEEGQALIEVTAMDRMRVSILVAERDYDALAQGQPFDFKVAAYPTRSFTGTVQGVARQLQQTSEGGVVVVAWGDVPNSEGLLRPNMTGFAEVHAGRAPLLWLVFRNTVRWFRVRFLV